MKLALLKGNRFNAWHLAPFAQLGDDVSVTAFRAESEIQRYFEQRDDGAAKFETEPIYFDTDHGPWVKQKYNRARYRLWNRQPEIVPFADRMRGYDVIQTWELFTDWSAQAIDARERHDVPVSVMVWDNIPFNMEPNPKRRAMKKRVAQSADRFIVHTERSRRVLDIEGVREDSILKIAPGVDLQRFSPGEANRKRFNLGDDDFVILFVGWLLPRKGLDFLLLALRELLHDSALSHINFKLLVIGDGPGRDRIGELVGRLDIERACVFAGSLPYGDMPEAFRSANVFVLPSIATPEWQEQFGMSLIEAMACGVPVVTTYTGAVPEIVGEAARLCQPNDFVSLYETVKELATEPNLCEELCRQGREHAEAHYDLQHYVQGLRALYEGLG